MMLSFDYSGWNRYKVYIRKVTVHIATGTYSYRQVLVVRAATLLSGGPVPILVQVKKELYCIGHNVIGEILS